MARKSTLPPILPPPGWNPVVSDEWAAGLFEGEGCLTRAGDTWQLRIKMTDLDVLQRFQHWAKAGNVVQEFSPSLIERMKEGRAKQAYAWSIAGRNIVMPILRMRPFLGARRGLKADAFLDWAEQKGHIAAALAPTAAATAKEAA